MITGKTIINEEVFMELAKTAMAKIDGVVTNVGQKNSLVSIARIVADKVVPQIHVKKSENIENTAESGTATSSVNFELKISILYGHTIPSTVGKVREVIKKEVESVTGYKVEKIDIIIEKLIRPDVIESTTMETTEESL